MIRHLLVASALCLFAAATAEADEQAFLGSLEGNWAGSGMVKLRADAAPINVSCNFDSTNAGLAFSLRGRCRALLVVSSAISADLKFNGVHYQGTYIGPRGARSGLVGNRRGDSINLTIHWAREVNGDHRASMTLQKVGAQGMKLMTSDVDPRSGDRVITSDINLQRR